MFLTAVQVNLLHPLATLDWTGCAELPTNAGKNQCVALVDKIYAYKYESWTEMDVPVYESALSTYKRQLVLISGRDISSMNSTNQIWSSENSTNWQTSLPPLPTQRNSPCVVNTSNPEYLVVVSSVTIPFRVHILVGESWLTVRTPQALSYSRAYNATKEVLADYFAKLGAIYARLNILSKPMLVFNSDEFGVSVVHKPGKAITELGRRCVWSVTSAEKRKNHIILACVAASGFVLPPFMIYSRKRVTENIKDGAFPGTQFHCSDTGWVNADLYLEWFKFFLSSIPPARPVLLIEDGHASHISIDVIELARKNEVYLLCLPSHTTHILQPLDIAVFKSVKSHYSSECRKYLLNHPGQVITTHNIASLIGKVWPLAFTPVNIMTGFKKAGAFPLNPGVVADHQVAPSLAVNPSCKATSDTSLNSSDPPISPCVSEKSSSNTQFSLEKEQLYQKRYEEGYDLPDPEYQQWLKLCHPVDDDSTSSEITHASGGRRAVSTCSESGSDVLSEVLKLPEPKPSSRRRRKGINSTAVHITDSGFLDDLKKKEKEKTEKEVEKQEKKERT